MTSLLRNRSAHGVLQLMGLIMQLQDTKMKATGKEAFPPRQSGAAKGHQDERSTLKCWHEVRERLRQLKAVGLCKEMERPSPHNYRLDSMLPDSLLRLPHRKG